MSATTVYLEHVFDQQLFGKTVEKTIANAERLRFETRFDTIAFTGISGSAMAFILSHWLDIPLLCVRKKGENSHYHKQTNRLVEGNVKDIKKYVIVDDFISSGSTVKHVIESIRDACPVAECVGMLMYSGYRDDSFQHPSWKNPVKVLSCRPENT